MAHQYPQRHRYHVLGEEGENFFKTTLPKDWVVNKPQPDYGQDLRVEVAEGGQVRGYELVVQIKASAEPSKSDEYETIKGLKTATYNYLKNLLSVVMFVKYVQSEREAYWVYLCNIPAPTGGSHATMTIRLPRANRVSEITWDQVATFVRTVTHCKLKAGKGLTVLLRSETQQLR